MEIKYPLFFPSVNKERILEEVGKVLDSKFIGQGDLVNEAERQFSAFLNDYYSAEDNIVAMVNSGTSGLHLAYILAGIKSGDEVLVPNITCSATNHPLLWMGAIPVFVDVQPDTLNVDPEDIRRKITDKTKAIVVMHNGGLSVDMDEIMAIAKEHNLKVIEDACQAIGGEYKGKKLGTIGDYGVISLQAIKTLSCGDGGFLICKNREELERAKRLRWFAIDRDAKIKFDWQPFNQRAMTFDVFETGYKYQPTNIDAAILIAQLPDLRNNLDTRKKYAEIYRKELKDIKQIRLLRYDEGHANWLFQIILEGVDREEFQKEVGKYGVETNMVQLANSMYSVFNKYSADCPNIDKVKEDYLSLPLHPKLSEQDIYDICGIIKEAIEKLSKNYAEILKRY
jgi:perosamine synthetase